MRSLTLSLIGIFAIVVSLSGCSSLTPTRQKVASFVIYDVQGVTVSRSKLLDSITQAVQKHQQEVRVTRDVPSAYISETLPRFSLKDPFAGTQLGAMMSANGQSMKTPICTDAVLTLASGNASSSGNTTFFLCVIPYKAGYSVNIYATFSSQSGGISVDALSHALAKSIAGDDSQFIPRAMNEVRHSIEADGGIVVVADSEIPESFKGAFIDQTASLAAGQATH